MVRPDSMKRRLVRAIVLGLIVSLLASSVAMASTPTDEGSEDLPETFAFAAPRPGEHGAYDLVLHGDWGEAPAKSGTWFRLLNYTRADGGSIRDGYGRDVATDVLRFEGPKYTGDQIGFQFAFGQFQVEDTPSWIHRAVDVRFRAGTRDLVAVDEPSHDVVTLDSSLSPLAGSQTRTTDLNRTVRGYGDGHAGLCILDNEWQGQVLPVSPLTLTEGCSLAGILDVPSGMVFEPQGWTMVRGVRAIRWIVEATPVAGGDDELLEGMDDLQSGGIGLSVQSAVQLRKLSIDYAPGISVPMRVAWSDSRGRDAELVLVGHEAGAAALRMPATYGPAWGPLRTTEVRPWGLDDTGVAHDFPLSTAFKAARDDLQYDDLRTFLAAHPDAVTWQATMKDEASDTQRDVTWIFTVGDGSDELVVSATRSWLLVAGQAVPQDSFSNGNTLGTVYGFYPAPQEFPIRVPTVSSLWERWRTVAGAEAAAPNMWSFRFLHDGFSPVVQASVGRVVQTTNSGLDTTLENPGITQASQLGASVLTSHGELVALLEETQETDTSTTTLKGSATEPQQAAPVAKAPTSLATFVPRPAQAAGASLVGVVVAVLYYLWPAAKSGGLTGLFSRLSKPEVLEHPQRVRILQAIEGNPGIHFQELLRTTALANGALVHHLRKLEAANAVVARKTSGYTCYFLKGIDRRDMDGAHTARSPGAKAILEVVKAQPGLTSQEAATMTGLAPSTVAYHAQKLAQAGLVTTLREGRVLRLHPGKGPITAGVLSNAGAAAGAA